MQEVQTHCAKAVDSRTIQNRVTQLAVSERRARLGWQRANDELLKAAKEYFASLAPQEIETAQKWFASLLTEKP